MEEVLERQLLIRGHSLVTFSTIEKNSHGPQEKLSGAVCCAGRLKASNFFKGVKIITLRRDC